MTLPKCINNVYIYKKTPNKTKTQTKKQEQNTLKRFQYHETVQSSLTLPFTL